MVNFALNRTAQTMSKTIGQYGEVWIGKIKKNKGGFMKINFYDGGKTLAQIDKSNVAHIYGRTIYRSPKGFLVDGNWTHEKDNTKMENVSLQKKCLIRNINGKQKLKTQKNYHYFYDLKYFLL